MARYIPPEKMTEADVREELENDFALWDQIMAEGCSDPFWPDGVNLNFVRNHIIIDYRVLAEKRAEPMQVSMFDEDVRAEERPVPPKVPDNYMSPNGKHPDRLLNRASWPVLTNDMTEVR